MDYLDPKILAKGLEMNQLGNYNLYSNCFQHKYEELYSFSILSSTFSF